MDADVRLFSLQWASWNSSIQKKIVVIADPAHQSELVQKVRWSRIRFLCYRSSIFFSKKKSSTRNTLLTVWSISSPKMTTEFALPVMAAAWIYVRWLRHSFDTVTTSADSVDILLDRWYKVPSILFDGSSNEPFAIAHFIYLDDVFRPALLKVGNSDIFVPRPVTSKTLWSTQSNSFPSIMMGLSIASVTIDNCSALFLNFEFNSKATLHPVHYLLIAFSGWGTVLPIPTKLFRILEQIL